MNTLISDKKYTLILSAYQATHSNLQNMIDTERMFDALEHNYHVHAIRATGVYSGEAEQSFVVHTNSANIMAEIRRMALNAYHQECVLVSNNRKHEIKLHHADNNNTLIGTKFTHNRTIPKNTNNYTILNGKDFYVVG